MSTIDDLGDALTLVRPAVARDRKLPAALRCILVERTGDVVRAVATDRHRLMVAERPSTSADGPARLLVDPDTLQPAEGVADEFPDYERFLAADAGASSATVAAPTLLDAIESAVDDDAPIAVQLIDGEVRLGAAATSPTLHLDGGYLHDAVDAAGAHPVVVEATGPTAPLIVRAPGLVTLVMPVRVKN